MHMGGSLSVNTIRTKFNAGEDAIAPLFDSWDLSAAVYLFFLFFLLGNCNAIAPILTAEIC